MLDIHHKTRWILSPLVFNAAEARLVPVAVDYSIQIEAPMYHNGQALCLCVMNAQQLAAARKDERLVVLGSIHGREPIHPRVAAHHAEHGVKPEHTVHEMLQALAAHCHGFEPEV